MSWGGAPRCAWRGILQSPNKPERSNGRHSLASRRRQDRSERRCRRDEAARPPVASTIESRRALRNWEVAGASSDTLAVVASFRPLNDASPFSRSRGRARWWTGCVGAAIAALFGARTAAAQPPPAQPAQPPAAQPYYPPPPGYSPYPY